MLIYFLSYFINIYLERKIKKYLESLLLLYTKSLFKNIILKLNLWPYLFIFFLLKTRYVREMCRKSLILVILWSWYMSNASIFYPLSSWIFISHVDKCLFKFMNILVCRQSRPVEDVIFLLEMDKVKVSIRKITVHILKQLLAIVNADLLVVPPEPHPFVPLYLLKFLCHSV